MPANRGANPIPTYCEDAQHEINCTLAGRPTGGSEHNKEVGLRFLPLSHVSQLAPAPGLSSQRES